MAFETAIARATKKINNASELTTQISNAADMAERQLNNISQAAFNRYKNYADAVISAYAQESDYYTTITTNYNQWEIGESIRITGTTNYNGYYTIEGLDETGYKITIRKTYTAETAAGTHLVLSNDVDNIIEGVSYLILFQLCNNLRNLEQRGVTFVQSELINGNFNYSQVSEVQRLQRSFYQQAMVLINKTPQMTIMAELL